MPMIDVFAQDGLLPVDSDRAPGKQLALAKLRAEGIAGSAAFRADNTAVFIHRLPASAVRTATLDATVRVQVITPPGALTHEGRKMLVRDVAGIIARTTGDDSQGQRTCVVLAEATEDGWGIAGTTFGKSEFATLLHAPVRRRCADLQ